MSAIPAPSAYLSRRFWPLVEVAIGYGLLEGALWTTKISQLLWAIATLTFIGFATWSSRRNAGVLGVGRRGFRQALWIVPAVAATCGLMILAASSLGTLHGITGARAPLWHALLYASWALVQEFLTMSFIFVRLEDAFETRTAVIATAFLFCIAHIPNLVLMAVTFPMSLVFCLLFRRYRNIYPLALSHAALGLTLSVVLPAAVTHSMRVGISYFFYV